MLTPEKKQRQKIEENVANDSVEKALDSQDTDQPANAVVQEADDSDAQHVDPRQSELAAQVDQIIESGQPIHMIQFDTQKKNYIVSD